jgi:O-acetyl-ADP-ribose deacetylase (regulator of RNase III)
MKKQVGTVTVRLVQGDICDRPVDAIVNAANSQLWMGSGVAGAIKRRGGAEIEREAVAQGPIAVGEAVVTSGGALAARYVIHAAAMGPDLATSARFIGEATRNALRRAEELQLSSIALPALGTGVGGFPVKACARLMLDAVAAHVADGTALATIEFALFGSDAYQAFASVLEEEG